MSSLVTSSAPSAAIFALAMSAWFMSEAIGSILLPSLKRGGGRIQMRARGLGMFSLVNWLVLLASFSFFSRDSVVSLPSLSFYAGITAVLLGICVRQWAVATLGRFFSPLIGIQAGQVVIRNGPYRLVRHPSYTGLLMIEGGVGLATQSLVGLLAILLTFAVIFGYRIAVEERMLMTELDGSYREYMEETKRLIPYLV